VFTPKSMTIKNIRSGKGIYLRYDPITKIPEDMNKEFSFYSYRYFMEPTMEKTRDSLSYLMPLINCINSECAEYMER